MAKCQQGVIAESNLHSLYLMFNVVDDDQDRIRHHFACFQAMITQYADEYSESELSAFIAIGSEYWDKVFPEKRPKLLKSFPKIDSKNGPLPHTPYDFFVHIRSDRVDVNHLVGTHVCELFSDMVKLIEQVKGFRYLDGRDLTGFVDGTENPHGQHRRKVALINETADSDFNQGSYIHVQRFRHHMESWNELPTVEQEDVIGRTKPDNIEYQSDKKPACSHIKRTSIKDNQGLPVEILRQSMPYGTMKVQGLFFISCASSPLPFELMLKSMYLEDENGHFDHLLNYTTAETGAAFFAPSTNFLKQYL